MRLKKLRSIAVRAAQKVYPRLGLRDSDIILASFPKSGNTWMRFIWANIVSLLEFDGKEVDFNDVNSELGSEYDTAQYGSVKFDCLPRLVKTHKKYDDQVFGKNIAVYLVRHPGDVMVSYFKYRKALNSKDNIHSSFHNFIRDEKYGITAWCKHVEGWINKDVVVVKYENLKKSEVEVIDNILNQIIHNIYVPDGILKEAVYRSSFDNMRRIEEEKGRPRDKEFDRDFRFVRKGQTGQWKDVLSLEDKSYLSCIIEQYGLTELYGV